METAKLLSLPDEIFVEKMNNFWEMLPDDHYPAIPGLPRIRSGNDRIWDWENGNLNVPYKDSKSKNRYPHSDLRLNQTNREFYLVIDNLVVETGISEEIDRITAQLWNPRRNIVYLATNSICLGDDRIPLEKMMKELKRRGRLGRWSTRLSFAAIPAVRRLLEMGYIDMDLFP
jgi:hypothetical protein